MENIKVKQVSFNYDDNEGKKQTGNGYVITFGNIQVPVKPVFKSDYKSLELLSKIGE